VPGLAPKAAFRRARTPAWPSGGTPVGRRASACQIKSAMTNGMPSRCCAGTRPTPAISVAASRRLGVVGAGERDHAAADAGGPGAASARGLLARWPTPPSLAAAAPGDAVRQWGRLGYPPPPLRLHATARILTDDHAGQVPASVQALRELPEWAATPLPPWPASRSGSATRSWTPTCAGSWPACCGVRTAAPQHLGC